MNAPSGARRTHPLTPVLRGWRVLAGVIAVIAAQNLARLSEEFTWRRALVAVLVLVAVLAVSVALAAVVWWRTTYEVDADGVTLRSGLLTLTRRTAPREKIESVSLERPALARALGLARVRIEIAGGSDSHLDLAYLSGRQAEQLRREILDAGAPAALDAGVEAPAPTTPAGVRASVRSVVYDGLVDGEPVAAVPTGRLVRSLVRDVGFMLSLLAGTVWVVVTIVVSLHADGVGPGALVALVPVLVTVPRIVLRRIEGGWGFVSRLTSGGLRMRRGLLSTRTDAIAPGRVQELRLTQPLLWRGPGWTAARATVAGIGTDDGTDGASHVLPVGTEADLHRTLDCLLTPLGTRDDAATVHRALTAPASALAGLRPGHRVFWLARRTEVVQLAPRAVLARTGLLARSLAILPRDRIQGTRVVQGPLQRLLGVATVRIGVAGGTLSLPHLAAGDAFALRDALAPDAARGRRYTEREHWPRPHAPLPAARSAA